MKIQEHKIDATSVNAVDVEGLIAEALHAAEYGSVPASDYLLQGLEEQATRAGIPLSADHIAQVATIRRTSRANGINRLLEQAEYEAEAALVVDSDFTTDRIRTYANEAGFNLTPEQEQRIDRVFRTVRANAIDEMIPEALLAAKQGRVEFVDGKIERVLRYAEEAGLDLRDDQEVLVDKAFRKARKETIKQALKKGDSSEDRETLKRYAEEAGIKLTKKQLERIN